MLSVQDRAFGCIQPVKAGTTGGASGVVVVVGAGVGAHERRAMLKGPIPTGMLVATVLVAMSMTDTEDDR